MVKLQLAAGNRPMKGYVNHDLFKHSEHIDIAFDLNEKHWPIEDNSYEEVVAMDVLEHLDSFLNFMDNCWRILQPGGRLTVRCAGWTSESCWHDPTHKRPYDARTFDYLFPNTYYGSQYGFYTDKKWTKISIRYDELRQIIATISPIK